MLERYNAQPYYLKQKKVFMPKDTGERANQARRYEVTKNDLPLSCPLPSMRVWDAHPRVYLPIEKTRKAVCPYCSAHFSLVEVK